MKLLSEFKCLLIPSSPPQLGFCDTYALVFSQRLKGIFGWSALFSKMQRWIGMFWALLQGSYGPFGPKIMKVQITGWPRFGSVRLRFGHGMVRAVPVFGSAGSSKEGVFLCFSTVSQRGRFRFRFRFLENGSGSSGSLFGSCGNGSDGSGFRFLGHPEIRRALDPRRE